MVMQLSNSEPTGGIFLGDDMVVPESFELRDYRKLGTENSSSLLWRNGAIYDGSAFIIPISLNESDEDFGENLLGDSEQNRVIDYLIELEEQLGGVVRFVFNHENNTLATQYGLNYIRVGRWNNQSGCWSWVGHAVKESLPQVLSLGPNCVSKRVVQHEIFHVFGFYHEHMRPDRDKYIAVHMENVASGYEANFNIIDSMNTRNTPYDIHSLMHYSQNAFSKDGSSVTMTSNNNNDLVLGNATETMDSDILEARMLFRCFNGPRTNIATNCAEDCPCTMEGEGFCYDDSGCASPLFCGPLNTCILSPEAERKTGDHVLTNWLYLTDLSWMNTTANNHGQIQPTTSPISNSDQNLATSFITSVFISSPLGIKILIYMLSASIVVSIIIFIFSLINKSKEKKKVTTAGHSSVELILF